MEPIVLHESRGLTGELTTLAVCIGYSGNLIFSEDTYYPPLDSIPSREIEQHLTVDGKHFDQLRSALDLSPDSSLADLAGAIAEAAKGRRVRHLRAAQKLLKRFKVPWEISRPWISQ